LISDRDVRFKSGHSALRVRTLSPEDVALAVDWAAAEGWNPGLTDASCFAAAAPDGFLQLIH